MRLNFNRNWSRYGGELGTVADHLIDVALLQLMRDHRCRVAGIDASGPDWKPEPIPLPGQAAQIRHRVVHVGRGYMRVVDDGVASIHGALIEVEEPLRLAISHHVAGVQVRLTFIFFVSTLRDSPSTVPCRAPRDPRWRLHPASPGTPDPETSLEHSQSRYRPPRYVVITTSRNETRHQLGQQANAAAQAFF